ncbi:MAG: lytic murein transglycosylase B [Sulfuricaulis sp.]|uniref:lytic murein transglycosylase B n=1 Tax=Sulfuricaulis sp. TaxID=2003553 RepID=UPI0025D218C2|nr:lytic murein transglycosylase B [Sulfuricaulis sp.]MCR4348114.1 lytic murein transglycosylase B [Sulfuricaulis sp.]
MHIATPERFLVVCIVLAMLAIAPDAQALDFRKYPALRTFAGDMAEKHGFSVSKLKRVFRCATIRPDIIEAMERPRELLPWHEYQKIFVTEDNARRGARFWKEHAGDIARAQEHYGVPPEIILAIIGVESRYGRSKGGYPVLDALATLTLEYPPRSEFFRKELEEFLLLAREIDVNPCEVKGSYAGAMGLPQFMPSSYRRLAVDFDGDGRRDLLDNPADTIGSIAHYLRNNGWETGAPIVEEVKLEGTLYFWVEKLGIKPALSVRQLAEYGIFPRQLDNPERRGALISLEGEYGPFHRLGFNNFYVITRYNLSKRYAMAVVELGEMIRRHREENSPT